MARPSGRDIRNEVIEAATRAMQTQGAAGFSYGSIAGELDIKAPSIHHHFPHKADLLAAVVGKYREQFQHQVDALDEPSARERLQAYASLFLASAQRELMCLCGAAAADWNEINVPTRTEVRLFFDQQTEWVVALARQAVDAGEFNQQVDAEVFATAYVSALEGSLLLARVFEDHGTVLHVAIWLLDQAAR